MYSIDKPAGLGLFALDTNTQNHLINKIIIVK